MGLIESFRGFQRKREEKLLERAESASIEETRLRKLERIKGERSKKLEEARAKIKSAREFKSRGRRELFKKVAKGASFISQNISSGAKMAKIKPYKPQPYKPMRIKPHKYKPMKW